MHHSLASGTGEHGSSMRPSLASGTGGTREQYASFTSLRHWGAREQYASFTSLRHKGSTGAVCIIQMRFSSVQDHVILKSEVYFPNLQFESTEVRLYIIHNFCTMLKLKRLIVKL